MKANEGLTKYRKTIVGWVRKDAKKRKSIKAVADSIGIPYVTAWRLCNTDDRFDLRTLERLERHYSPSIKPRRRP